MATNYIPLVLQIEILCRLAPKSLIRFQSVSKEWKSLIDSSEFNSDFIKRQPQRKRFLLTVAYVDDEPERGENCWIVDDEDDGDDSFPQNRISLTYPRSVNPLLYQYGDDDIKLKFVGSSHGLICFTSSLSLCGDADGLDQYVIWNPCIRKSVSIVGDYYKDKVFVGFGVCTNSFDPKIVRINILKVPSCDNEHEHRVWQVEVYTLSAGVWRSPLTNSEWFDIDLTYHPPLVSNGFIYWCAYVTKIFGADRFTSMIVSFDLATEKFTKIPVPDKLSQRGFRLFKLRGSLGAIQVRESMDSDEEFHEVWLTDDVSKLLTKVFTITLPDNSEVVGFRDNGQVIINKNEKHVVYLQEGGVEGFESRPELVAYDPDLKQIKDLGLHDVRCLSFTSSYTESLLLLDQSNALNDDEE
ncbi:F-box only protein 8-like [Rutidosis leptorrhynchoides]|uniref:F-box only protein 8-like n=1 Tax=Rutidosis leptorrhynchoides TaxID=125765 RepID=UPI003A98FFF8